MKSFPLWRGNRRSIRSRVLAIVVIPCTVLLILGVSASGYLVIQGSTAKKWADQIQVIIPPSIQFVAQVQEERRLTLLQPRPGTREAADLATQRQRLDVVVSQFNAAGQTLIELNPAAVLDAANKFWVITAQLPGFRQKVDAGQESPQAVYGFYNQLVDVIAVGLQGLAQNAPETINVESTAADLFQVLETMSRSNALAAGDVTAGGLNESDLREYRNQVGAYHMQLQQLLPRLTSQQRAQCDRLVASPAWQQLTAMENALIERGARPLSGPESGRLPLSTTDWQNAASQVTAGLNDVWNDRRHFAEDTAAAEGARTFRDSLLACAGVLLVTVVAFLIAVRLSNRLVRRLKRLRAETLELADKRLPDIVERLREGGAAAEPDTEIPPLDYGSDEVGEVADAFNRAQQTAVAAAALEAKTREGMAAVFRNIAHRSQIVVRRQIEVLDEAERKQDDPAHLELLFRLDHLTTRARRNAENLIVLGGGRAGRRWRNPVRLEEIARSAVSETEDFARVGAVRLPDVAMEGAVVADLIHLLAELVDNACRFSPPTSRVEVRGNLVGKGVVVEVEDQGLGIATDERELLNAILQDAPDFQIMALSERMRLGLFVVSQLAARHGVAVTLTDSDYGGTRAIVLIPTSAIATRQEAETQPRAGLPVDTPGSHRRHQHPAASPDLPAEPAGQLRGAEDDERAEAAEPAGGRSGTASAAPAVDGSVGLPEPPRADAPDGRAPLPRRRRQENLAPQLAGDAETAPEKASTVQPEQARQTMAALLRGTRQARQTNPQAER